MGWPDRLPIVSSEKLAPLRVFEHPEPLDEGEIRVTVSQFELEFGQGQLQRCDAKLGLKQSYMEFEQLLLLLEDWHLLHRLLRDCYRLIETAECVVSKFLMSPL